MARLADPVSGNRYAYAGDNPVNRVDPTGAAPFWEELLVGWIVTASVTTTCAAVIFLATGGFGGWVFSDASC